MNIYYLWLVPAQYVHFSLILQYAAKIIPTLYELSLNSRMRSLEYVLCAKKSNFLSVENFLENLCDYAARFVGTGQ